MANLPTKKLVQVQIYSWRKRLKDITEDVTELVLNRYFYKELVSVITNNSELNKGNHFWDFLKSNYIASSVLSIGRQMDTEQNSQSLINLLNDIFNKPELLTKIWFASNYSDKILNLGEKDFESHFGIGEYVDPELVYADIGELIYKTKKITLFRHQAIAHMDVVFRKDRVVLDRKKGITYEVSFDDIDVAINTLEQKVMKYNLLLNQAGYGGLLPIIQYDWQEIFRKPWIKDEI